MVEKPLVFLAKLLAGVGAINWGLVEFSDTNLIGDTLGFVSGSDEAMIVYGLVALGGIATIYYELKWQGVIEVEDG